ncbi:MAG: MBL fold metallo-hydrolase [Candidatus Hermodarchaeota archaeon]|nr:MBL fold metallo-hydrolase [Candidatus Hermodarchaeota archaeon]
MVEDKTSIEALQAFFELPLEGSNIAFLYIGYAGILLRTSKLSLAFDLGKTLEKEVVDNIPRLDLLFLTHTHWDHYHAPYVGRIHNKTSAHIIAEPQVAEDLVKRIPSSHLTFADPKSVTTVNDVKVTSFIGVHPRPITLFHVAYDKFSIFHAGDSGHVPVKNHPADLAFLPTGTPSPSCTPETALEFTLDLRSKVVVPMHGNARQMNKYKELAEDAVPGIQVVIPDLFEPTKLTL